MKIQDVYKFLYIKLTNFSNTKILEMIKNYMSIYI